MPAQHPDTWIWAPFASRALTTAPQPPSQGSHLRSLPLPTPGPSPNLPAVTLLRPVHRGTRNWKYSGNHTTSSMGTVPLGSCGERGEHPTQDASLRYPPSPQGAFKSPRNHNREYGEGHEPRAAHPSQQPHTGFSLPPLPPNPWETRAPQRQTGCPSLYQTSHTPFPRLSKQAGSEVAFSAGAARRKLPRLS